MGENSKSFLLASLLGALGFVLFNVFVLGVRGLVRSAGEQHEWAAALTFGAGLLAGMSSLTFIGLFSTAALDASTNPEPAAVPALLEAENVIATLVSGLLNALFLAAAACGVSRASALPLWTAWVGWVAAALNLLSAPAILGGTSGEFYTATGLASVVMGMLPLFLWVLVTSIAMLTLRSRRPSHVPATASAH